MSAFYNPEIHHRRSIRLKNYDYSSPGAYFITICTKNREDYFGRIKNGKMILNSIGNIVKNCWEGIPEHFDNVDLDSFVIMPNHVHGIIIRDAADVSSRGVACKDFYKDSINQNCTGVACKDFYKDSINQNCTGVACNAPTPAFNDLINKMSMISPKIGELSTIIRSFKSAGSRIIHQNQFPNFSWQRNYYEHIIRNEFELNRIREYIINNPLNWEFDRNNV